MELKESVDSKPAFRPIEQIIKDVKKLDTDIANLCSKRSALVDEADLMAKAALEFTTQARASCPEICSK